MNNGGEQTPGDIMREKDDAMTTMVRTMMPMMTMTMTRKKKTIRGEDGDDGGENRESVHQFFPLRLAYQLY